jgi:hypothetical protein
VPSTFPAHVADFAHIEAPMANLRRPLEVRRGSVVWGRLMFMRISADRQMMVAGRPSRTRSRRSLH